jgi:hypothetical protein
VQPHNNSPPPKSLAQPGTKSALGVHIRAQPKPTAPSGAGATTAAVKSATEPPHNATPPPKSPVQPGTQSAPGDHIRAQPKPTRHSGAGATTHGDKLAMLQTRRNLRRRALTQHPGRQLRRSRPYDQRNPQISLSKKSTKRLLVSRGSLPTMEVLRLVPTNYGYVMDLIGRTTAAHRIKE